ncbi:MAG TPA: hypothetical protein VFH61_18195 [Thermoleophilia bacterium]|nr:hypothetical protein [Thermoleophilia bacterium]
MTRDDTHDEDDEDAGCDDEGDEKRESRRQPSQRLTDPSRWVPRFDLRIRPRLIDGGLGRHIEETVTKTTTQLAGAESDRPRLTRLV